MTERFLSLGFDDERPYGKLAATEKGKEFRARKLEFVQRMHERFDAHEIPRTHFILSSYLEAARADVGEALLRKIYPTSNPLIDIGQHSHSHGIVEPLHGVNQAPMTAEEYGADIEHAAELITDILGTYPRGLRTPYGYERDFSHRPDVLKGLRNTGIKYVSSDLGMKETLYGAMTEERQPHSYDAVGYPDIIEVPSHGPQDAVFTREKAKQLFNLDEAPSSQEALDFYTSLLDIASRMETQRVSVALCLHPWAMMEYDPELDLLLEVAGRARDKGFEVVSYRQVADQYRQ